MAIAINHSFVSAKADGADTSIVRPSNWNAALVWSGLTANALLYSTDATTLAQSVNLTYSDTLFNSQPGLQLGSGSGTGVGWTFGTFASGFTYMWNTALTPAADNYIIRAGSSQIVLQGTTYFGSSNTQRVRITGSVANPTIAFGSSFDAGLTYIGAGVLGVSVGTDGTSAASIRCKHQASDGTAGVATFGPSGVTSITVKDGIITAIS